MKHDCAVKVGTLHMNAQRIQNEKCALIRMIEPVPGTH